MPDFSPSEQIFSIFFLLCLSWQRRTCCRKQQNKIQPTNRKKASANFSGAKTRGAHFFGRQHLCSRRQPADTLSVFFFTEQISVFRSPAPFLPAVSGQHLQPAAASRFHFYTSRRGQLINCQALFCSFGFSNEKTRGAHFSVSSRIQQTGILLPA